MSEHAFVTLEDQKYMNRDMNLQLETLLRRGIQVMSNI